VGHQTVVSLLSLGLRSSSGYQHKRLEERKNRIEGKAGTDPFEKKKDVIHRPN